MHYSLCPKLKNAIQKLNYNKDSYYIFDEVSCKREIKNFINAFNKYPAIFSYSYKTNYCKPLIDLITKYKFLSEVVSPFEVDLTKLYGIDPSNIIYNGPVKDYESIKYVLEGKGIVNADNLDELFSLVKIASEFDFIPKIGIRVSMESKNLFSRFGIEFNLKNIKKIIDILKGQNLNSLDILHIHFPDRDLNAFRKRIEAVFSIYEVFQESFIDIKAIDIGGGFPSNIPKIMLKSLSLENISDLSEYSKSLDQFRKKFKLENIPIVFEPGTAIAANSFHLVGNIHSINYKKGFVYFNTDLSRTLLGGLHNQTQYPINLITKNNSSNSVKELINEKKILAGFSCVEGDKLIWEIPKNTFPERNDKVLLSSIGSYSTVFKPPFIRGDIALFNWDGFSLKLCKRAQTANDILNLYLK